MRISLRSALLLTSVVALLLAIGVGVLRLKEHVENSILDSYRLIEAGKLFINFKDETGTWPHDWECLEEYATSHGSQLSACETVDDLQCNIEIDFSIDSEDWSCPSNYA